MDAQTGVTIQEVVTQVVKQVAVMSAVTVPVVYGVGEALKKVTFRAKKIVPGWVIGVLAAPIGVLVSFLLAGFAFTPAGILAGILGGFAASASYSTLKSATSDAK